MFPVGLQIYIVHLGAYFTCFKTSQIMMSTCVYICSLILFKKKKHNATEILETGMLKASYVVNIEQNL